MAKIGEPNQLDEKFFGHNPRECGEHRTVGAHRAWCYECGEWCYPRLDMACKGCEMSYLRSVIDKVREITDGYFFSAEQTGLVPRTANVVGRIRDVLPDTDTRSKPATL